jgi:hypothetical protein
MEIAVGYWPLARSQEQKADSKQQPAEKGYR